MIEILVLLTFATAIAEVIISGRWLAFYFRSGIPLFVKSFQVIELPTISPDSLSQQFSTGMTEPIVFRRINNDEIGFREKFFSFRLFSYSPIMHGLIRVDQRERKVSVIGYANWTAIVFPATFLLMDYFFSHRQPTHTPMTLFLVCIMAALYLIQFTRYKKVHKILEEKFSGKYSERAGQTNT